MSVRKIYYSLPPQLRFTARRLLYWPLDLFEGITKRRSKYEPPKGLIYTGRGSGSFLQQGQQQLGLLKRHLEISPKDKLLDIGSGIGRTAIALTGFLDQEGKYEGFDVVKMGVDWCKSKIKPDFPNFNFTYVPLQNDLYNSSDGTAENFQFPYSENTFDKAFLFSVFTHMQVSEIQHYLQEIQRVLKPGGSCLATFFVYDKKTEEQIAFHQEFKFPFSGEGYRIMDNKVKSANIAFETTFLDSMITQAGLQKLKYIEGYWKDDQEKSEENDFQDIVVMRKP